MHVRSISHSKNSFFEEIRECFGISLKKSKNKAKGPSDMMYVIWNVNIVNTKAKK